MRFIICLAALAGAGLIVACGQSGEATHGSGGGHAAAKSAKAEFVKKANRICAEFNSGVDTILPQTPGDTSHIYEAFMFRFQSLAPQDKRGRALVADGFNVSEVYKGVEDAIAQQKGPVGVKRAKAAVGVAKAKFDRGARAYGLKACANGRAYAPRPARAEFPYPGRFGVG
jgi:hypothetical protein